MTLPAARRAAYLEALGIDAWVPRRRAESPVTVAAPPAAVAASPALAPPAIDGGDWPELEAAVGAVARCTRSGRGRFSAWVTGRRAGW
jgi:hypothetical protein